MSTAIPRLPNSIEAIINALELEQVSRSPQTNARRYIGHWNGHTPPWHDANCYDFDNYLPGSFRPVSEERLNQYSGVWYSEPLLAKISWTEGDVSLVVCESVEAL